MDVLGPHVHAPSEEPSPSHTRMLLLHPPRGYGVGVELGLERAFFNPDGARFSLYYPS